MNQLTKTVILNCRYLHRLLGVKIWVYAIKKRKPLTCPIPDTIIDYINCRRNSTMPENEELSLEQIKALSEYFVVPINFLIDDNMTVLLQEIIDIKNHLCDVRTKINSAHFSKAKNASDVIFETLFDESDFLKEVINNETNIR